jgi:hypothetical protein
MGNNATPRTTRQRRRRRYRTTTALILTGTLAVAACGGDDDDSSAAGDDFGETSAEEPASSPGVDADDGGFIVTDDAAEAQPPGDSDDGGFDIGIIGRDVIIEMRVVLSSDNIQRTVSSIMAHASSLGGGVASSDVDYGRQGDFGNEGYAVLVVKVPPQSLDSLLAGLDDTGTVQSINQSAQDVTEQLIDLEVRISNARQSVANVRDFMDRTENLNELVTLEGELTRRQTDLERLEAQQRNLGDRVALSTVTIEVIPTASVPEPIDEESDTISDAFEKGWDAFTGFVFGIGFILAVLLPFLALAAIVGLLGWAIVRRRRRNQPVANAVASSPLPEPVATPSATVSSTDAEPANQQD